LLRKERPSLLPSMFEIPRVKSTPQGSISPMLSFINNSPSIRNHSLTLHHMTSLVSLVRLENLRHSQQLGDTATVNSTFLLLHRLGALSPHLPSVFAAISDTKTQETSFPLHTTPSQSHAVSLRHTVADSTTHMQLFLITRIRMHSFLSSSPSGS
jgi:hypothetical protein